MGLARTRLDPSSSQPTVRPTSPSLPPDQHHIQGPHTLRIVEIPSYRRLRLTYLLRNHLEPPPPQLPLLLPLATIRSTLLPVPTIRIRYPSCAPIIETASRSTTTAVTTASGRIESRQVPLLPITPSKPQRTRTTQPRTESALLRIAPRSSLPPRYRLCNRTPSYSIHAVVNFVVTPPRSAVATPSFQEHPKRAQPGGCYERHRSYWSCGSNEPVTLWSAGAERYVPWMLNPEAFILSEGELGGVRCYTTCTLSSPLC